MTEELAALMKDVRAPAYVVLLDAVESNCRVLKSVAEKTGCRVILAQKAFSLPAAYPIIAQYLDGVCASGLNEARMGREDFAKEVQTYCPAFTDANFGEILKYSDKVIFNSLSQWHKFKGRLGEAERPVSVGLRVNPGHSEVENPLYDPCRAGSRFGVLREELDGVDLTGIDGLHFHALCEQGADVLERVLESFEEKFGEILKSNPITWVNFGGGHHITKPGYDLGLLCRTLSGFSARYPNLQVYVEPGEAVVYNAGYFVAEVVDLLARPGMDIAVLDASAETHTPDVLAMPYRPQIVGSGAAGDKAYTYRLGGSSCLAGDFFGEYSFDHALKIGDRLAFTDMALYSFVKNTTFNGVNLPALYTYSRAAGLALVREFGYDDFRNRLAGPDTGNAA
ncbi:MAG TPA: carboxynorspermidine decarboxylase [Opitutales bacterium]|nr:carboxynorspermidine decarboxylase [Opitutales bacterium]